MERSLSNESARPIGQPTYSNDARHTDGESMFEIWPVFQRHWALILTVFFFSVGLGVIHYLKMPPTYESTAQILLETKRPPTFSQELYGPDGDIQTSIETHSFIIRSHLIVGSAIKSLGSQIPNTLKEDDDVIKYVQENLTVSVMGDDTSIVTIRYSGKDPTECQLIVGSLVKEYESFLGKKSQSVGQETTRLITKAKDDLLKQLAQQQQAHDQLRKTAPLLWQDGKGVNPHQARQLELEAARSDLMVKRSTLVGKIKTFASAASMGGSVLDALKFEARRELMADMNGAGQLVALKPSIEMDREAAKQLIQEYMDVKAEKDAMTDKFGTGHPDIQAMNSRIERLRQQIIDLRSTTSDKSTNVVNEQISEFDYVTTYLESLQEQLRTINQQLDELNIVFEREQESASQLQNFLVADENLRREKDNTQTLFDAVVARLQDIDMASDHNATTMNILAAPNFGEQIKPTLPTSLAAAGFLGLLVGFGIATIVDRTAATFRGPTELREELELPILGRIPAFGRNDLVAMPDYPDVSASVCAAHANGSNISEAYGAIRTSLYFSGAGKINRVIQITSPIPGDGKSTLTANMAVTLAKSGKRVLVIDADMRKPTQHRLFGISNANGGLSDAITGILAMNDCIRESNVDGVHLMPAGTKQDNPSELLVSHGFEAILKSAAEDFGYDFVLVDTPPVLAVTDPVAVAARVDSVILAIRLRRGVKVAAKRAKEMLSNVGANISGVVVNNIRPSSSFGRRIYGYTYGYGYGNGYGQEKDPVDASTSASPRRLEYAGSSESMN